MVRTIVAIGGGELRYKTTSAIDETRKKARRRAARESVVHRYGKPRQPAVFQYFP